MALRNQITRRGIFGVAIGLVVGTAAPASAARRKLRGNVLFRSRGPLPADARVTVQLVDISLADAPAGTIAQTRFRASGNSPLPYELEYDTDRIRPGRTYALQARIQRGEELLYINTTRHTVFGDGRPRTDITVERVGNDEHAGGQDDRVSPVGSWRAREIAGSNLVSGSTVTLDIAADGKVTGSGGCNRYFGKARLGDATIRFGDIGSTRMACSPALMQQEAALFDALRAARTFELRRGRRTLVLLGRGGRMLARFSRS